MESKQNGERSDSSRSNAVLHVLWDIENCFLPPKAHGGEASRKIIDAMEEQFQKDHNGQLPWHTVVKAFVQVSVARRHAFQVQAEKFHENGVKTILVPNPRRGCNTTSPSLFLAILLNQFIIAHRGKRSEQIS